VAVLDWVCDDGKLDEKDAKLAAIVEAHRNEPASEDALAAELADYVGLAVELKKELEEIGAFDPGLIAEGKRLVLALRERSAVRVRGKGGETAALLAKRNQLAAVLAQRINRVRAAARYVFPASRRSDPRSVASRAPSSAPSVSRRSCSASPTFGCTFTTPRRDRDRWAPRVELLRHFNYEVRSAVGRLIVERAFPQSVGQAE
jgi:hypothetical protein